MTMWQLSSAVNILMLRKTFVEIDRSAIRWNLQQYRSLLPPDGQLMAVVKADAYGHGAVEVAKIAETEGVAWLGVAMIEEGLQLRDAGISLPILILGAWPEEGIPYFYQQQLTPMVYNLESAQALEQYGKHHQMNFPVHLCVDTGMSRLGLNREQLNQFLSLSWPHLLVEGVQSHLASADKEDPNPTLMQLHRFWAITEGIDAQFLPRWVHVANSAGTSSFSEDRGNLFRVGIGIYGQQPSGEIRQLPLRQAMKFQTQIVQLQWFEAGTPLSYGGTFVTQRRTQIACLAVGYADGYSRQLSNRGRVLIRGYYAPVCGLVCMDMILVDVTDIPDVSLEDPVVLIGKQEDKEILASELAEMIGTINYEVCCHISNRVPRCYKD